MIKINYKLKDVKSQDKQLYYDIKKLTCEKYVKMYFGSWNEQEQISYNNKIFDESLEQTCFKSIVVNEKIVGFFGYSIFDKEIGCVTLQILRLNGRSQIFSDLLSQLTNLSNELKLPIYAKSFLASKDIKLYEKSGFKIMETTKSHYLLKREI